MIGIFSWSDLSKRFLEGAEGRLYVVAESGFSVRTVALVMGMAFVFLASPHARSQVLYGAVSGTVTDPNNAVVAGAKVDATEMRKGITAETTTDSSGFYRFSELLPGLWKIVVSAPGFTPDETDNITVDANSIVQENEKLGIAKANVTVTVSTAPPELQTERADVHVDLSTAELQELPSVSSEGKNFQDLLRIIPGANIPTESNSAGGNPARGMTTNVNGQSTQGNDTRIDGILDAYPWLPNNVAYIPPEDAVETVNVATNAYDAEQGMVNGAEINVQMRTGTNQFHGDAFEFHTDDQLKAENYFSPPPSLFKRPIDIFNQFGGAVGGPIFKDKLFFYGDYQGTRQIIAPASGLAQTVPTAGLEYANAEKAGYFQFTNLDNDSSGNPTHIYDPNTGNPDGTGRTIISAAGCGGPAQDAICLNRVDPAALTMASLIPAPSAGLTTATTNNYLDTQKGHFFTDEYDGKINWVPTQKSTIFGHFSTNRGQIFDPPSLGKAEGNATNGGQLGNATTRIYVIGLGGTHTFTPNLLLDGNIGYTRQHLGALSTDIAADGQYGLSTLKIPGTNNSAAPADQLYWGIPAFQFVGYTNLGNPNTGNPFVFRDNQYVANGNLTWVKGHHQLRFGGELDHTQLNHFQPQGGTFQTARGSFGFNGIATEQANCTGGPPVSAEKCTAVDPPKSAQFHSFADFLLGLPYETGTARQDTNPIALRWSQWAIFGRDQYQVTPKLSIDYGIRWEYYPMAYSDHGKGARVLNPTTMMVLIGGYGSIPKNDGVQVGAGEFLPRVGIDYKLNEKTVVRAGFGISADSNNWRYLRNDYPADTVSTYSGTNTGSGTNYTQFAPAASLTGTNGLSGTNPTTTGPGPYVTLPTGIVPIIVPSFSSGSIPMPQNVSTNTIGVYPKFRRGYIYSYNLTLERQFAGFVGDASYVGAREIRPILNTNLNAGPAGGGTAGQLLNAQVGGGATFGSIQTLVPLGHTYYDALQTKLTRRFGQSSSIGVIYTWSKAEDFEDNEELSSIMWPYPAYFSRNKALAGFNRRYNFETYAVYDLPFGAGQQWATHGIASALAGGWTLTGVLSRLAGAPFSITDSGAGSTALNDNGTNSQTVNLVGPVQKINKRPPPSSGLSACELAGNATCAFFSPASFARVTAANTFGTTGRNWITGPGYFGLDASVLRNFKIAEFLTFQFSAEAIGVTNTPHFANPDGNINDAGFGIITGEVQGTNAASLGGSQGERLWFFQGKFIF
ncbi:MAG TPA: TonB-dependent receptor [Terracidiphilus sp.]|jgi:hypothetical protein